MDYLLQLGSYLNDPELVASIQQKCGIEIYPKATGGISSDTTTDAASEEDTRPSKYSKLNGNANNLQRTAIEKLAHKQQNTQRRAIKYSMTNNVEFVIHKQWMYYLACFGAFLGNESFNCYFFPYWIWNVDGYVCRRVVIVWCLSLYIGQYMKDIICWPRPRSPPAAKLEQRYELEYGMPSTHATVGFSIPFSLLYLTGTRYIYFYPLWFSVACMWTGVVSFSRVYLGMHSVLDVICGLLLGTILLPLILPWLDIIDHFQLTSPWSPVVMVSLAIILALAYPTLNVWSTARGDTTMTLAVCSGVSLASWLAVKHDMYTIPMDPPPYYVVFPDLSFWVTTLLRMSLGGTLLMATRSASKFVSYRVLCAIQGLDRNEAHIMQRLSVELPYKFITYNAVAFNVVYLCPLVFRMIGIERVTDFTDL